MKKNTQSIFIVLAFIAIISGLAYDSRVTLEVAKASYSPSMDSPLLNALATLPPMNSSMIHVDALGAPSQTTANDFGVSLIGMSDAASARTLLGVGMGTGTVTSIIAGTGLSGGTITGTGTVSLPNTGTAGTYSSMTTDAQGRVTAGANRSFTNTASHSIVSVAAAANGFQISSTKDSLVSYSGTITTTATIGGSSSGTLVLEICSTNSATAANWQEIARVTNGQAITLALTLQSVQTTAGVLAGMVPAGYYARIRSINNTGTPTYAYNSGQEIVF